jgi:hypothetical protein
MAGICVGMPSSNGLNSISQAVLAINWVAEGRYKYKLKLFFSNKPALVLCSFYIMHLLGLLYTTNFNYGFEDVNKKLPLFLFPFVFSSMPPLQENEKKTILLLFTVALMVVSFIGTYLLIHHLIIDIHDISPFIAPVRLGMMIDLSLCLLCSYIAVRKPGFMTFIIVFIALWLLVFLFIMQSLTSVIMLMAVGVILLLKEGVKDLMKSKIRIAVVMFIVTCVFINSGAAYLIHLKHDYFPKTDNITFSKLDKFTLNGRPYNNDTIDRSTENGHYLYINLCPDELKASWNKLSAIPIDSPDLKGNPIRYTLLRYLASKNLSKDSVGVSKLNRQDITSIENSIPDYKFNTMSNMQYRIYQVFWEFMQYHSKKEINGHSVLQRFEYWKAAIRLISRHPFVGVGTGDVRMSMENEYKLMNSKLITFWRLRAHNQFLAIGVGFGLIGILWFLVSLFYPPLKLRKLFTFPYLVFWVIFMISLLTEDTLETEAGATFYAFFNSFFLFL